MSTTENSYESLVFTDDEMTQINEIRTEYETNMSDREKFIVEYALGVYFSKK